MKWWILAFAFSTSTTLAAVYPETLSNFYATAVQACSIGGALGCALQ